ncbi:hypothetical protein [Niabella hibiscisoli]|uniref:hypothetical protein n=1 Tax=Niabella hibiscisoli TaxID=1825928 RepID=UPI001F113A57|nr:hypothetical protein [Niabella hibiscisoli]MCH5715354.1 hypothetical protein [Niabella hibiscisoli]
MSRRHDKTNVRKDSLEYFERIEKSLATKLSLTDLDSGIQLIRDENGGGKMKS